VGTLRLTFLALAAACFCSAQTINLQARNVRMRLPHGVLLEIGSLRGKLERTEAATPVTFDDLNSFAFEIQTGSIAISSASLAELLNSYVFAYPGSPLTKIGVEYDAARNRIKLKGTMHKGVELPFEIEGPISVTADGNLGLHADKIKSGPIPFKGLLHLFGEDLSKLVNGNEARGVRIDGDDITLYPGRMVPPPQFKGRLVRAYMRDDRLFEIFDSGQNPAPLNPPVKAKAYIYHRGGVLRFGKLTMDDADLELVRDPPGASFEFFPADYKRQLVAGYSKYTADFGLVVHMPDYSKTRPTSPAPAKAPRGSVRPGGR
jgi:hypothetical protein